jgi:hypothetical protein
MSTLVRIRREMNEGRDIAVRYDRLSRGELVLGLSRGDFSRAPLNGF